MQVASVAAAAAATAGRTDLAHAPVGLVEEIPVHVDRSPRCANISYIVRLVERAAPVGYDRRHQLVGGSLPLSLSGRVPPFA